MGRKGKERKALIHLDDVKNFQFVNHPSTHSKMLFLINNLIYEEWTYCRGIDDQKYVILADRLLSFISFAIPMSKKKIRKADIVNDDMNSG